MFYTVRGYTVTDPKGNFTSFSQKICSQRLSETGWSWGDGPGAGVPASVGVWPEPADAGTPGARSGGAGHPACRGTDVNHLFRQSLRASFL